MRLYQGDYNRETVYSEDPLDTALRWQSKGAPRLHMVDLDGAKEGRPVNLEVIEQIATTLLIPTQLGGGIRDLDTVKQLLKMGVERVILGTAAVEDPELVRDACKSFGEHIIVGIDAHGGRLAVRGWREETTLTAAEVMESMMGLRVGRFIYTDISRDGTLTEPNFSATFELTERFRAPIIAAGGICRLTHLKMLARLGVEGAIIGKALYTGDINLKQALAAVE